MKDTKQVVHYWMDKRPSYSNNENCEPLNTRSDQIVRQLYLQEEAKESSIPISFSAFATMIILIFCNAFHDKAIHDAMIESIRH